MSATAYTVKAKRLSSELYAATLSIGADVVAEFEGKSTDDVTKKARALAEQHKAANTPASVESYEHQFHL